MSIQILQSTEKATTDNLRAALTEFLNSRLGKRTTIFLTGGSSCPYWMPFLFSEARLLKDCGIFFTDFFAEEDAKAEGRNDTNEQSVLDAGLQTALEEEKIHPDQVFFPPTDGSLDERAAAYSKALTEFCEGQPRLDFGVLSSGGATYSKGGPEDPGHVAGMPHSRTPLFFKAGRFKTPFVVVCGMPKPPSSRVTMTPDLIRSAELLFMFCLGEAKHNARNKFLDRSQVDLVHQCPARLAYQVRGEAFYVS